MDYLDPSFQHFHDQLAPCTMPQYPETIQNYGIAQPNTNMTARPSGRTNETKPRLGKDEVGILEREFQKNQKPTTQTKIRFAREMGVEQARINNWFQNRRAKRKQEKKQEAYEAGQNQDNTNFSDDASPDFFDGSDYFSENQLISLEQQTPFSLLAGPPPPVASYNPQYSDPSSASMESLHRTMAAAQAASQQDYAAFPGHHEDLTTFAAPLLETSLADRSRFPTDGLSHFSANNEYSFESAFPIHNTASQSLTQTDNSPAAEPTPTLFRAYTAPARTDAGGSHPLTAFPSQLLPTHSNCGVSSHASEVGESQSPQDSNASTTAINFKYDIAETTDSSASPPAPSVAFKSPPPPTDLASRRKKVQVRPAALTADTLRGRPSLGPRTVSHADNLRRPSDSPLASPMRRIVSAGGNTRVVSGRIGKSGVESAQRSPINMGGFSDARSFMEHTYHSTRKPPSLTAGSSLNSSLAPPTPMSPHEMTLFRREGSRSTTSPVDGGMNYVFNAGVFTTIEQDQNLASPPETPQAQMTLNSLTNGWPPAHEYQEKPWQFDVSDEPLYTPAHDSFNPLELHMPQPSYISSLSQPVTPAFGQFNTHLFSKNDSPQYSNDSSQYALSASNSNEYAFPDPYACDLPPTSPMNKQKTFQFSNTTPADFS